MSWSYTFKGTQDGAEVNVFVEEVDLAVPIPAPKPRPRDGEPVLPNPAIKRTFKYSGPVANFTSQSFYSSDLPGLPLAAGRFIGAQAADGSTQVLLIIPPPQGAPAPTAPGAPQQWSVKGVVISIAKATLNSLVLDGAYSVQPGGIPQPPNC